MLKKIIPRSGSLGKFILAFFIVAAFVRGYNVSRSEKSVA